jgi:hypothetical protein
MGRTTKNKKGGISKMKPSKEIILAIYWAIWAGAREVSINGKMLTKDPKITRFRHLMSDTLLYIEQNPATGSEWAAKARAGSKVIQIMKRNPQPGESKWVGVVVDEEVIYY